MNWRSLINLLVVFSALGCLSESDEDSTIENHEKNQSTEEEISDEQPSQPSQDHKDEIEDIEDEGFDPCPEVEYTLLEKNGRKYTVMIEVFCEPYVPHDLGCPAPY